MAKNDLTQGLPQTGDPLPTHAKPPKATLVPEPRPVMPAAKPVPDQHPKSNFKTPDRMSINDIKVEGARRAAMAEGGSKERTPR